jgi:hypothetical protein
VWDVFANVEHWPQWTTSVERIVALNGPELEVGKRFEIKQPKLPTVVWEVTKLDRGASWTWRARSPGNTTLATHEVVAQGSDRTLVRQRIEQRGPLGALVGVMLRRLTRRYLELEAQGLKARSEKQRRRGASAA